MGKETKPDNPSGETGSRRILPAKGRRASAAWREVSMFTSRAG